MNWKHHIVSDKTILQGKPTIKGTRLSVEFLLELLADGWTEAELLESYPRLTSLDIQAVFSYVYNCMKDGMFSIAQPQGA